MSRTLTAGETAQLCEDISLAWRARLDLKSCPANRKRKSVSGRRSADADARGGVPSIGLRCASFCASRRPRINARRHPRARPLDPPRLATPHVSPGLPLSPPHEARQTSSALGRRFRTRPSASSIPADRPFPTPSSTSLRRRRGGDGTASAQRRGNTPYANNGTFKLTFTKSIATSVRNRRTLGLEKKISRVRAS